MSRGRTGGSNPSGVTLPFLLLNVSTIRARVNRSAHRRATSRRIDDQNARCCTATIAVRLFWSFAMNEVVERILSAYQSMCPLDAERAADSWQKINRYIESLVSAGQRDAEQLTIYGLAVSQNCTRGKILGSPAAKRQNRCFRMPGKESRSLPSSAAPRSGYFATLPCD